MQALLSQRPGKISGNANFTLLRRAGRGKSRQATTVTKPDQLPTWSQWVACYATEISYSVRHIRRLILNEPRKKTVKECGWSISDHHSLIRAATCASDLVAAMEHGADTTALVREIQSIMNDVPSDLLDREYEPKKVEAPRRPARKATRDAETGS